MPFFPTLVETFVLSMNVEAVEGKIRQGIEDQKWVGYLHGIQFSVQARLVRPTPFLPVIQGTMEATSIGCILFLRYRLLPATRLYLGFWSVVLLLAGAGTTYVRQNMAYVLSALLLIGLFRWIALANLKLQQTISRKLLLDLFNT